MMGVLRHIVSGRTVVLAAHSVAGRASNSIILLEDPLASNTHAAVQWTGERWEVRDHGSTNKTFVGDVVVPLQKYMHLPERGIVQFGSPAERWELIDGSGPVVVARSVTTGEVRAATDGLLPLPDRESVLVLVRRDGSGEWVVETPEDGRRAAKDAEVIVVGGQTWQLTVPPFSPVQGTYTASPASRTAKFKLTFHESTDKEHVSVDLVDEGTTRSLGERTCFDMLLHLARERRRDAEEKQLPEADQGWLYVSDLMSALKVSEQNLNVMIFRVREVFAESSVTGTEGVLERRRKQIRIGLESARLVVD